MDQIVNTILTAASIFTACGILLGALIGLLRWLWRQKQQDVEIERLKREQTVICYGLLACLDGLRQLGCNGNVTAALDALDKHLNKAAHK